MRNRIDKVKPRRLLLPIALLSVLAIGWSVLPAARSTSASGAVSLETPAAQASKEGDVERGRDLFMGNLHFENGGPPCMGCHNVGENGLLGGGAIGPDLTNVSSQRSQAEILAVLSNTGRKTSPVMRPIYTDHPLIWEEQVALLSFLEASIGQPESDRELLVVVISLGGFLAAVGLIQWVYRNRLRGVRKPLVRKAQS